MEARANPCIFTGFCRYCFRVGRLCKHGGEEWRANFWNGSPTLWKTIHHGYISGDRSKPMITIFVGSKHPLASYDSGYSWFWPKSFSKRWTVKSNWNCAETSKEPILYSRNHCVAASSASVHCIMKAELRRPWLNAINGKVAFFPLGCIWVLQGGWRCLNLRKLFEVA